MSDAEGKSGRERGAENVEALRTYVAALEAEGRAVPERGGKVNVSAVALACGFDRQVLYSNPAAKALLEEAVGRLGLGMPEQRRMARRDADSGPDPRDRRIHQLEQANASLRAELHALREEKLQLKAKLARLGHIEAHIIETGRRVAP